MRTKTFLIAAFVLVTSPSWAALAKLEVGKPAPQIPASVVDAADAKKKHKLSDFKGKYVVLEWLNHGCPFVRKHYDSGNMQALQNKYKDKNVVWISVVSSSKGKQGWADPKKTMAEREQYKSAATAILIDESGEMGQAYGAKTTPHMYVIDPAGKLIYQGAIDDKKSTEQADVKTAMNYVDNALQLAMAGKAIPAEQASTEAYGCSVKYK